MRRYHQLILEFVILEFVANREVDLFLIDSATNVNFNGKDNIIIYDSSDWADRGFCSHCGMHLFYHLKQNDQYILPIGLFPDSIDWNFDHQILIDKKPNNYCYSNKTKEMSAAEIFAQLTQSS